MFMSFFTNKAHLNEGQHMFVVFNSVIVILCKIVLSYFVRQSPF